MAPENRVFPREIGSAHRIGVLFRQQIIFLGLRGPEDDRPFYGSEWQIGESLDSRAAKALSRRREPSLLYTSRRGRRLLPPLPRIVRKFRRPLQHAFRERFGGEGAG